MSGLKIVAIVLIIGGVLALIFGGFTYTKDRSETQIGPLELAVEDKESVNIPVWAGVGAIIVGGLILVSAGRKP